MKVLAIVLFLAAAVCLNTALKGTTQVGSFLTGRYGWIREVKPVKTVDLSSTDTAVYYGLGFTFLVGSFFCIAKSRK